MEPRNEGPDFIGVGVQKSGTSWLADILAQHPGVLMPKKEIHFFNRYFYKGYGWYHNWFRNKEGRMAGDFTPGYFISPLPNPIYKEFYPHWNLRRILLFWFPEPSAREELKSRYPGIRVFAVFRNPVDRAWSAYWDWRRRKERRGKQFLSFDKLWTHDGRWLQTKGLYAHYLSYWRGAFPDFGVFFYDDIRQDPIGLARALYRFIGVDENFTPEINRWVNKGAYEPMPPVTRKMLVDFYREQIVTFSAVTSRDLSSWLKI